VIPVWLYAELLAMPTQTICTHWKITDIFLSVWWISWFGIIGGFLLVGFWEYKLLSAIGGLAAHFSIVLLTVIVLSWILFYVVTAKLEAKITRDGNWHSDALLSRGSREPSSQSSPCWESSSLSVSHLAFNSWFPGPFLNKVW
jgi:hypothetical protein